MIPNRIQNSQFFILVCLFLALTVTAQQLPFANLKISDGLEDTVIFAIEQDKHGFLWIATRTGINRFDGNRFWTYGQEDGLPHNLGRDLLATSDGTLWVASERGIAWFDGVAFQTLADWPENTSSRGISEAADGSIWVATYGSGLLQIASGKNPKIIKKLDFQAGMPSDRIRSVFVDKQDNIWAGFSNKVVRVSNAMSKNKIEIIDWHIKKTEIRSFYQHTDGTIWAGTRNGIAYFNGKAFERLPLNQDLSNQTVNTIARDQEGYIWIGTRDFGVYKLDNNLNIIHLDINDGLPDNSVNSIFQDNEKNIWFGTYGGGIARLSTTKVLNWKAQSGFPKPNVYSIANDKEGCFWFSTNGNGISKLCHGMFTHITRKDGIPNNKVLSVMIDNNGDPWFGTLDGISHLHEGKFTNYGEKAGITGMVSYQIIQVSDGSYWVGTNNGLNHFDGEKFVPFNKSNGLPDNRINRIIESNDKGLWLATANGLAKYNNKTFSSWTMDDGLPANFINDIYPDDKGGLWIATNNGLSYFKEGLFTNWSRKDGLPHNNCTVILPGVDGEVWIGTSRGVAIFDSKNFSVITSREGLVYDLVNRGAGYRDSQGNLWFGTGEGVSRFAANFKPGTSNPPPIHIISVNNNNKLLSLEASAEIEQQDSSLKFNYSGISFQRAPDVNYRYRLNNTPNAQWRETRLNELQIDSLAAGHYKFEVTARIGQGNWNNNSAVFNFKVIPPFWKTYWFMALIFALIIAAFLYRNHRIKQYSVTLEHEVKKRTKQLEKVNQGLEWLANHDSLTRLANRNNVHEKLTQISQTSPQQLGVIIIDLDYFKSVNDEYGHMGGDKALELFAAMLQEITQDKQLAARWGGEEFLIVCPQSNSDKLQDLSRQILNRCRQLVINMSDKVTFQIRCSIGFALSLPQSSDWKKTIQLADSALYEAKHDGRDCAIGYLWQNNLPADLSFKHVLTESNLGVDKNLINKVKIS